MRSWWRHELQFIHPYVKVDTTHHAPRSQKTVNPWTRSYLPPDGGQLLFVPILDGPVSLPKRRSHGFLQKDHCGILHRASYQRAEDIAADPCPYKIRATRASDGGRAGGSTYSFRPNYDVDQCMICTWTTSAMSSSIATASLACSQERETTPSKASTVKQKNTKCLCPEKTTHKRRARLSA